MWTDSWVENWLGFPNLSAGEQGQVQLAAGNPSEVDGSVLLHDFSHKLDGEMGLLASWRSLLNWGRTLIGWRQGCGQGDLELWVTGAGRKLWKVNKGKCQVQEHSSLQQQARLGLQAGTSVPSWMETLHCTSSLLKRLVRSDLWRIIPKYHLYPSNSDAICLFIPFAPQKKKKFNTI